MDCGMWIEGEEIISKCKGHNKKEKNHEQCPQSRQKYGLCW